MELVDHLWAVFLQVPESEDKSGLLDAYCKECHLLISMSVMQYAHHELESCVDSVG